VRRGRHDRHGEEEVLRQLQEIHKGRGSPRHKERLDDMSGFFGVDGAEYWKSPWKNLKTIGWNALLAGRAGLTLDGRAFVTLDARKAIPLLAYRSDDQLELPRAPFLDLAVVVLATPAERQVLASRLPLPTAPKGPQGAPSPGFGAVEYKIELTELF